MLRGIAKLVVLYLFVINILGHKIVRANVVTIQGAGKSQRVYDLTVDGAHEFFASGILVHNCMDALRYSLAKLIKRKGKSYYDY